MEDPNRPVIGYPAPNPPPAGAAYPYAAYNYQNYHAQSYDPDPDALRRAACLRRVLAIAIGILVAFCIVNLIVWLVLRPQLPEFRVDSFELSNFVLTNNSHVSLTSQIRLTARNPNKKMALYYNHIGAGVYYEGGTLSETTMSPFAQSTRNETSIAANFVSQDRFLDESWTNGMNREIGKGNTMMLDFRMVCSVNFEAEAWKTNRFLKVFCGDLVVGIPSNGKYGALTGGPKHCRVGI